MSMWSGEIVNEEKSSREDDSGLVDHGDEIARLDGGE
jgi:hypothetical protein